MKQSQKEVARAIAYGLDVNWLDENSISLKEKLDIIVHTSLMMYESNKSQVRFTETIIRKLLLR